MQKSVTDFLHRFDLSCDAKIRYMDLVSEVGELGKELIKGCDYGKMEHVNTINVQDELGDCLFSLLALCYELGIDAKSALAESLTKYEGRFAYKGGIGSGK